ncbi:MAG: Rieske (2Fe-2S) protein [Pseudonocardia sp.]|nr:Rieske (2Fe-2S) protein [Pseudonocardia sp.]
MRAQVRAAVVPVGGGVITDGVVVTQPVAGTYAAFDPTCPHLGCAVRGIAAGTISCFCHGSRFRIADGSVAGGPAPAPLTPLPVEMEGDTLRVG